MQRDSSGGVQQKTLLRLLRSVNRSHVAGSSSRDVDRSVSVNRSAYDGRWLARGERAMVCIGASTSMQGAPASLASHCDDVSVASFVTISCTCALVAAMLANKFAPAWRTSGRSLVAALIGGLLLGYGARIAYGCNIGAYFSGIASGSIHGWLWMVAAFAGNIVGVRLRPMCDLAVERTRA